MASKSTDIEWPDMASAAGGSSADLRRSRGIPAGAESDHSDEDGQPIKLPVSF